MKTQKEEMLEFASNFIKEDNLEIQTGRKLFAKKIKLSKRALTVLLEKFIHEYYKTQSKYPEGIQDCYTEIDLNKI